MSTKAEYAISLHDKGYNCAQAVACTFCKEFGVDEQEMFKIAYPRQRSMIEESACVILPYYKQKYPLSEDKNGYGLMDYGATWALIENMLLAATAEGVGSVVHIPVKKEPEQIKNFLKVPDGWGLPAMVVLGYSIKDPLLPAQVKATVENKVRWNKW